MQACQTLNPRLIEPLRRRYVAQNDNQQEEIRLTSPFLYLDNTILYFRTVVEGKSLEKSIDLSRVWLPASAYTPHPAPLIAYPHLLRSVLFSLNRFAQHARNTVSTLDKLTSRFSQLLSFAEWGLLNGLSTLAAFTRADIKQLEKELKKGGIRQALQMENRLVHAVRIASPRWSAMKKLVKNQSTKSSTLFANLAASVGMTSLTYHNISPSIYQLLTHAIEAHDQQVPKRFTTAGYNGDGRLNEGTIKDYLAAWNSLAEMPEDYDCLSFTPFPTPAVTARKLGYSKGQTKNLEVDELAILLKTADLWIQHSVKPLCTLLTNLSQIAQQASKSVVAESKEGRTDIAITSDFNQEFRLRMRDYLSNAPEVTKMEQALDIRLWRNGLMSNVRNKPAENEITLRECINILTGSCFILIAIYNARRKSEIANPITGLRRQDIGIRNEELGLYSVDFHLSKKAFTGRVPFIVNHTTAKAIKALLDIKKATGSDSDSLFSIPNCCFNGRNGRMLESTFNFTVKSGGATGKAFLEQAFGALPNSPINAHAFRRFYAVLFHYQYSDGRISALTRQLGHASLDETIDYITDTHTRELHDRIVKRIKRTDTELRAERKAVEALKTEVIKECRIVGEEKLAQDIVSIITGEATLGGNFPLFVIRAHRFFSRNVEFAEKPLDEQGKEIADLMIKHGRHPKPARHNNCVGGDNNEARRKHHKGVCMPERCLGKQGCMNSCVFQPQLETLKSDLIKLQAVIDNDGFDALPIEVLRAEQKHTNISRIIELQQRNMVRVTNYADSLQEGDTI
ncbi:hypothetical protein [Photobacterium sanguinicancri]|uniref:hypothetical protein n=1 Tax=Photobacterium sanguinicancri TaxID=875932 RepID=UPI003D12DED3